MSALSQLVCYTISDSDSEPDDPCSIEIKPDPDLPPQVTANSVVGDILDGLLHIVINGTRDFSDMYIKEEPIDVDDIKEELNIEDVYRDGIKVEMNSESDDSDDSDQDSATEELTELSNEGTRHCAPRTKNELTLAELPPVEDLDVRLPESEVVKIGIVSSIVDELVVVESLPGNPAIDLDSVLFLDSGSRALGHVFDVIGPVRRPYYCVRFNSKDHIEEKKVIPGIDVYYAPKSEYTNFVFLDQLMKLKISDASWRDDEEPPPQFLDYSDDEEERRVKQDRVIEKMRENGATEEEVERKRARYDGAQRGRGGAHRRGTNNRNAANQHNGNMEYNSQRHDNGLYSSTTNPFYRQTRNYNPRDMGPVRWSGYMPGGHQHPPHPQHPQHPPHPAHSRNTQENLHYNDFNSYSPSPGYSASQYADRPGYRTTSHMDRPGYNTGFQQGSAGYQNQYHNSNHNHVYHQHQGSYQPGQGGWWTPPPPPPRH